jgi:hypothetical protein
VTKPPRLFEFPNPVNETSARLVAGGVVAMCSAIVFADQRWVLPILAYGFVARVLTGPTLSPLGQLVTRLVTPRLRVEHRFSPGQPKRFAQGIGATLSLGATIALFVFDAPGVARVLVAMIAVAAFLEAAFGLCLGCVLFKGLIRAGLLPDHICFECADIGRARSRAQAAAAR